MGEVGYLGGIDTEYSCRYVLLEVGRVVQYKIRVENEGRVSYKICGKKRVGVVLRYKFTCGQLMHSIPAEYTVFAIKNKRGRG